MRAIKYRELKHLYEGMGAQRATQHLGDALRQGHLRAADFSLYDLGKATLGQEFIDACRPGTESTEATRIFEASEATDSTAFSNITGQIVFSRIMQAFEIATQVGSQLVDNTPTTLKDGEKVPGITFDEEAKEIKEVKEGMPYPAMGLTEDYVETPPPKKYGPILPVTKEAIFFDRTGLVLQRAAAVGEWMGVKKEKLIIDMVSGYGGGGTPTFAGGGKWKWKGTEYAVYNGSAVDWSSYFYVNHITDTLVDHTDIDAANLKFGEMQDPNTREPINLPPTLTLLVPPALTPTANRIKNSTEVRYGSGDVTTVFQTQYGNTLNVVESKYLFRRLIDNASISAANARAYWFIGDFKRAFSWMENWPLTISQAPTNAEAEFKQDIVLQYKASMRGGPAVISPHYVIRSTGAG
jgi:hypothetical protein